MTAPVELLVYRFGSRAGFEGHLLGALERFETSGALTILDLLVVGSDDDGERFAIGLPGHRGSRGVVEPLLSARLDAEQRRRMSRRTLDAGDERAELAGRLADALPPGQAVVALLVGHEWRRVLAGAVARTGGLELAGAPAGASALPELAAELLAAVSQGSPA